VTDKAVAHVLKDSPYRGGVLLVHVAAAYYCDPKGEIHATPAELATMARQTPGQVRRVLARMLTDGLVAVIEEAAGTRPARYKIVPVVAPVSATSGTTLAAQSTAVVAPVSATSQNAPLMEPKHLTGQDLEIRGIDLDGCDPVPVIFAAWQAATGHHRAKLSAKRRALVKRQLKEYPARDLLAAVQGVALSAFHMGENDTGARYDSLELVLRDCEHIERFRDLAEQGERVGPRRNKGMSSTLRVRERMLAEERSHSQRQEIEA
jgi:hypothetical protein